MNDNPAPQHHRIGGPRAGHQAGGEWGLDARLGSILWPLKNDEVQK